MEAKCKNCKFWEKHISGWCYRYPVSQEKEGDSWCGEFKIGGDGAVEVRHDFDGKEHLRRTEAVCPICQGSLDCGKLEDGRFGCEGLVGEKKVLVKEAMENKVDFNGSSD